MRFTLIIEGGHVDGMYIGEIDGYIADAEKREVPSKDGIWKEFELTGERRITLEGVKNTRRFIPEDVFDKRVRMTRAYMAKHTNKMICNR